MPSDIDISLTRKILENLRSPDQLNDHPWAGGAFVRHYTASHPAAAQKSPGYQLAEAVAAIFEQMKPGAAPKRGKRLDTQWGTFGILAAQYFAPFQFGLPYPQSLRDAWGKIDPAILLFQFGSERNPALTDEEKERYKLVGDELEVAPLSTISDWHVSGIEQLADCIADRERHLLNAGAAVDGLVTADLGDENLRPTRKKMNRRGCIWSALILFALLAVGLSLAGREAYRIYQLGMVVYDDLPQIKSLASIPKDAAQFERIGPALEEFHGDLSVFRAEAGPYLRTLGPWLNWVPDYGADIAASAELLDFADQVVGLAQTSYAAAAPLYLEYQNQEGSLDPVGVTKLLVQAQPQLQQAQRELEALKAKRDQFDPQTFSLRVQELFGQLDAPLGMLEEGLSLATALPNLLGAGSDGPKTYLILVQNEDELRPTGGFITSVGTFVIKDGQPFGLQFEDAGDQEDWSLPYPKAPWQLQEYMNSQVLVLRDANWFPDYPTAVGWVEYLYAYKHDHSVDGVIAIDQQLLVLLLKVLGPVSIEGADEPITADNVIAYMRAAKTPPEPQPAGWYRKAFISQIGNAIYEKLVSGEGVDWKRLAEVMQQSLNHRHLLLQFDDPVISAYLAKLGWDGAVQSGGGDFWMAVDSNIGFNKANAAVEEKIAYDVDLTDLTKPIGTMAIFHMSNTPSTTSCIQWGQHDSESRYPIHFCYWNYLRIYVPQGSQLLEATPHAVPADWMILQQAVPARVDALDDNLPGLQGYGTLLVVPGGQTMDTRFTYALPESVVKNDNAGLYTYTLTVKKQPGTAAVPIAMRVHLPAGALLEQVNLDASVDGNNLLVETNLQTDVLLTVSFRVP